MGEDGEDAGGRVLGEDDGGGCWGRMMGEDDGGGWEGCWGEGAGGG